MAEEKQKTKKHENIFTLQIIHKHHKVIKEIIVAVAALSVVGIMAFAARQYSILKRGENIPIPQATLSQEATQETEEEIVDPPSVDTADWKVYNNPYYGFKLKYPTDWKKTTVKSPPKGSKWRYRYLFRKSEATEDNPYIGFDVVIYDVKKIKELTDIEEFPELKNQGPGDACSRIEGHLFENPDYPAEEIYIPPSDDCYNTDFFYSLTRDEYIYNFIPILKDGADNPESPKKEIIKNFPEFFGVASSIDLVDIVRPKPKPPAPKITAPKPVSAIRVNGRLVCAKKNDHPSYSDKTSHKHLDMECCLDPDEYPNPWCYYPPSKYGKYL